ncbi:hypothetical protein C0Q70_19512 [Pomacea canaliculata]|uniref:Uncharacterized protein n=1 Tax=Pomacea canaliculata TaxID=400727 RepID=A0A2T7NJJ7_POMCA|nr:hypothetical protein C0Q70_19512 [Pomacea canaliculata]
MPALQREALPDKMQTQQVPSHLRRTVQTMRRAMSLEMRARDMPVLVSHALSALWQEVSQDPQMRSSVLRILRGDMSLLHMREGEVCSSDALDVYVKRKRFTPGTFLACPACTKPFKDWDCWRYHSRLRRRRQEEDKKKTILKDSTLVSKARQYKITKSMDMLDGSVYYPRSFSSSAFRRILETADLDVNKCFALTNQIKLARMIEMVDRLFLQLRNTQVLERSLHCQEHKKNSISDLQDDVEYLKGLVLPPVDNMSEQRLHELTSETRRLVYTVLLTCLKGIPSYHLFNSTDTLSSLKRQADQLLQTLKSKKKGFIPMAECERLIEEGRKTNSTYEHQTACVDLSVLGASPEVDLCDIGKADLQSMTSRLRTLLRTQMNIDD